MKGTIYIICPSKILFPTISYGGIERCILNLYKGFSSLNQKTKILCVTNKEHHNNDFISMITDNKSQNFNKYKYHSDEFIDGTINFLKENISKKDFVIFNHIEQIDIFKIASKKGIKSIQICHYNRDYIKEANIVFLSKTHKLLSLPRRRGVVIHLPVDPDVFYYDSVSSPMIKGDYLLSVGRICRHKRTYQAYILAKAMGIKLVVAGPIQDQKIADKFLHDCEYLGNCNESQLRNLYSNAICSICITSMFPPETGGTFAIEALMCGSPTISSKVGSLMDTFQPLSCIEYSSYKPLSFLIKEVNTFLEKRTPEIRSSEIERAKSQYSPRVIASKYLELIKNVNKTIS